MGSSSGRDGFSHAESSAPRRGPQADVCAVHPFRVRDPTKSVRDASDRFPGPVQSRQRHPVDTAPVTALLDAALGDDTGRLVEAAEEELHRPLGLVSSSGATLGCAPPGRPGRQALAVAAAAARSGLVAPPGWDILKIERATGELGFLAAGARNGSDATVELDLVARLLAEHVERRELLRAHRTDFLRRLVREPIASPAEARRQAAEIGLCLAPAYWPAVLAWRHVPPRPEVVESVARHALAVPGALAVGFAGRLVLLHPPGGGPDWFEPAVIHARERSPAGGAQAVVAEAPAPLTALSDTVTALERLWRLGPRTDDAPLLDAGQFALDRLLADVVERRAGRAFVDELLAPLLAWDAGHGGNLAQVLEAGLDFPRHDHAARRCFMHRNTFRHRMRLATEVLGRDLDDPDVRLAVHVALKLRRVAAR
jgi:PucR-like helix-turn-helix protein